MRLIVEIEKNTWLAEDKDSLEKAFGMISGEDFNFLVSSRRIKKLSKGNNKVKILKIDGDIIEVEEQTYQWKGYKNVVNLSNRE